MYKIKIKYGKPKGFTLVELILAIILLSIVSMLGFNMLRLGKMSMDTSSRDYKIQMESRLSAQVISQNVRNATAIFTMSDNVFNAQTVSNAKDGNYSSSSLTREWDYFGIITEINSDGKEVSKFVQCIYRENPDGSGYHEVTTLLESVDAVFKLIFNKSSETDTLISFTVTGTLKGEKTPYVTISPEIEALNTLQVVDRLGGGEGVAIAFRSDVRPSGTTANISMVLDVSGSMAWTMDARQEYMEKDGIWAWFYVENFERINALKESSKDLISGMSANEDFCVSIVPFSDTANNVRDFKNIQKNFSLIEGEIDSLTPVGDTNTGDGLRRAYYKFKSQSDALKSAGTPSMSNYVILFSDGATNACTTNLRGLDKDNTSDYIKDIVTSGEPRSDTVHTFPNGYEQPPVIVINKLYAAFFESEGYGVGRYEDPYSKNIVSFGRDFYKGEKDAADTYRSEDSDKEALGYVPQSIALDFFPRSDYGFLYSEFDLKPEYSEYHWEYLKIFADKLREDYDVKFYYVAIADDSGMEPVEKTAEILRPANGSAIVVSSREELDQAFQEISKQITMDYWQINGPAS